MNRTLRGACLGMVAFAVVVGPLGPGRLGSGDATHGRRAQGRVNRRAADSADVVPSLKRWGRVASVGRVLWKFVESVDAKDPYTLVIFGDGLRDLLDPTFQGVPPGGHPP